VNRFTFTLRFNYNARVAAVSGWPGVTQSSLSINKSADEFNRLLANTASQQFGPGQPVVSAYLSLGSSSAPINNTGSSGNAAVITIDDRANLLSLPVSESATRDVRTHVARAVAAALTQSGIPENAANSIVRSSDTGNAVPGGNDILVRVSDFQIDSTTVPGATPSGGGGATPSGGGGGATPSGGGGATPGGGAAPPPSDSSSPGLSNTVLIGVGVVLVGAAIAYGSGALDGAAGPVARRPR
jgi:hypothetical protein